MSHLLTVTAPRRTRFAPGRCFQRVNRSTERGRFSDPGNRRCAGGDIPIALRLTTVGGGQPVSPAVEPTVALSGWVAPRRYGTTGGAPPSRASVIPAPRTGSAAISDVRSVQSGALASPRWFTVW